MSKVPTCAACGVTMKRGFIPDRSQGGYASQLSWHPGTPEEHKVLGIKTGNVKFEKKSAIGMEAYRCPSCGLVLQFARR